MIQNSIKKAVIINMISKYSTVIIQLIINAILSRLLLPEEFGIVAVITVFINFFNILSDMGIGAAIIQNKELDDNDNQNIFSFTFYIGIVLGIIFIVMSFVIAWIYGDSRYILMCSLLFFSIFFNTINMVPNALLLKEKRFFVIGIRTIVVTISCGIITIITALLGWGCYSLIFNSIITSMFIFLWNYKNVKNVLKFKVKIEKESLYKVKDFSIFQFGFSVINYFSRNTDNLLIGAFMGATTLAFYDKSYKLMLYPINMLTNVITPTLHPILSEYQNQKVKIYDNYIKILKFLSIIASFIAAFCYFNAKEIILIMFGNNWNESIICFKILSFSVFAQMLCTTTGSIFQSLGKTKEMFKVGTINTIITIILILIGITTKKLEYISVFIAVAYNIHFIITFYSLIVKIFNIKFHKFISSIWKELFIYITLILASLLFNYELQNIFVSFIIKSIYLVVIYIVMLLITKEMKFLKYIIIKRKEK